jgi:succinoglycan biosynthesis transport protein ExoP
VAAIGFSSGDPAVAQKIAQGFAEAFRDTLADANSKANQALLAAVQGEIAKADDSHKAELELRYRDLLVSRALPGMDVVIISEAKRPGAPIAPRKGFLITVAGILGAALGAALAGWREMSDRGIRNGEKLAARLGVRFFGYLPRERKLDMSAVAPAKGAGVPDATRLAVATPFSPFAETLRSIATALSGVRPSDQPQTIGIVSALPGEAKTIVAANLASLLAAQGRRVLLVDANVRNPTLGAWLAGGNARGLADIFAGGASADEVIKTVTDNGISLLAAGTGITEPALQFGSIRMRDLVVTLRSRFDHVIFDLPALSIAADARALEPSIDRFVLAAEWGGPTPELIEGLLANEPEIAGKLSGLVVTKTDYRALGRYLPPASRGAFTRRIWG